MDGIAFGCLAALLAHRVPQTPAAAVRRAVLLTGLVLSVTVFCFRKEVYQLGLTRFGLQVTLLELGIALMLVAAHWRPWTWCAGAMAAPLRWFGCNSYEVYLSHMFVVIPAARLFQRLGASPSWIPLWFFAVVAASGLLGQVFAQWFSEPCNRALRGRGSAPAASSLRPIHWNRS